MSRALSVCHGVFGRASLYELDRPLVRHAHREAHLLFFLGGCPGEISVGDRPFRADRTTAVAINPWEEHGFMPSERLGSGLYLIFYFNPEWLKAIRAASPFHIPFFPSTGVVMNPALREVRDEICQVLAESTSSRNSLELHLSRLLQQLDIERPALGQHSDLSRHGNWNGVDFRLRKSIVTLSSGRPASANLTEVARSSGLSRAHFFKLFREQLGLTPVVYANALRIETALGQIARKQVSITTISEELGFSCQSAFTRFFTAHVGMPPTDYRRAVQIMGVAAHG
jgi:AraC-like DNA-binding protein